MFLNILDTTIFKFFYVEIENCFEDDIINILLLDIEDDI